MDLETFRLGPGRIGPGPGDIVDFVTFRSCPGRIGRTRALGRGPPLGGPPPRPAMPRSVWGTPSRGPPLAMHHHWAPGDPQDRLPRPGDPLQRTPATPCLALPGGDLQRTPAGPTWWGNRIKLLGKKEGKGKSEGKREVKGNQVEKWVAEEIKLDATLFTFYKLFRSTALIVVFVFQFI